MTFCAVSAGGAQAAQWFKYNVVGNQAAALAQMDGKERGFYAQSGEPQAGLTLYLDKKSKRRSKSRFEMHSGSLVLVWPNEKGGAALDVPRCERGVSVGSVALCYNVVAQREQNDSATDAVPGANTSGPAAWHKGKVNGKDYYYTEADLQKGGPVQLYTKPVEEPGALSGDTLKKGAKGAWSFQPKGGKALKADPVAWSKLSSEEVSRALAGDSGAVPGRKPGDVPDIDGSPVAGQDDKRDSFEQSIAPLFRGHEDKLAARLYELIWEKRAPGSFVSEEARKAQDDAGKGEALKAADLAAITAWVQRDTYRAALLYYAIGPGNSDTSWMKGNPKLQSLFSDRAANPKFQAIESDLVACLGRWAGGEASKDRCSEAATAENPLKKPLAGGAETRIPWLEAFLADASVEANKLLTPDVRKEIQDAINRLRSGAGTAGETPSVDGRGGGKQPPAGVNLTKPFGVAELFGKWGDYNVLYVDGRKIAVVLRNSKASDAAPNQLNTEVGIYDITNESDIFGRRFSLDYRGAKEPFVLDDRNAKGKRYVLEFVPQGNDKVISIKSGDGGKNEYSSEKPYDITLNKLFQHRAEKVKEMGNLVEVGGQKYYVSAESSDRGSLLFWNEKTLSGQAGTSLQPEMMAYVNRKVGGVVSNIKDQVSLGKVGAKWYDLKWNSQLGIWQPVVGTEPKPEAPPTTPGTGTTSPGTTSPGTTSPGTTAPSGGTYIGSDGWPVYQAYTSDGPFAGPLNKALRADLYSDIVRFYDKRPAEGASYSPLETGVLWRVYVELAKAKNPPEISFPIPLPFIGKSVRSAPAVIGGRILRTDTSEGVLYIDVEKGLEGSGSNLNFRQVAAHRRGSSFQVPSKLIMEDLLPLIGYKPGAVVTASKNLEAQLVKRKAKTLVSVNGFENGKLVYVVIPLEGGSKLEAIDKIFPPPIVEDFTPGQAAPDSPEGVALDASSGGITWTEFDDGYQPKDGPLEVAPGKTLEAKVVASHKTGDKYDAVVYEVKEEEKYHYYLAFSVRSADGAYARQPKYPLDLRLNSGKPLFADGKGGARGVVLAKVPESGAEGQFRLDVPPSLLGGSNDYQASACRAFYDAPSARKRNVQGVVVWWGMSEEAAKKKAGYPEK
ncbi:MAG TPA: hypothetical protein DCM05_03735 [Elusimicrobia bacterium]|nr:hypothetical protein [Elusimicrobiota bacterium]